MRLFGTRDERGAIAVLTAISTTTLLVIGALAIDIGLTWARRGELQTQADQAALLGAEYLPAHTTAEKQKVARVVAWYLCTHSVPGQSDVDPTTPSCPDTFRIQDAISSTDAAFTSYADRLQTNGHVSFPTIAGSTGSFVRVETPAARVEFGFGKVTGNDSTDQDRIAVAQVGSPGHVAPMSLSLNCLLSAANNLPAELGGLNGVLPLNYIAPGRIPPENVVNRWPSGINALESNSVTLGTMTPSTTPQGVDPGTVSLIGSGWDQGTPLIPKEIKLVFALGDQSGTALDALPSSPVTGASLLMSLGTAVIPSAVWRTAGDWEVRIAVRPASGGPWTYSKTPVDFPVTVPVGMSDLLGCARTVKSPRDKQTGTGGNLMYNAMEGLDHALAMHPSMVTLNPPDPVSVSSLLTTVGGPTGSLQCSNADPHILDNGGSTETPNCVFMHQETTTRTEFTEGFLGAARTIPANLTSGTPSYTTAGRLVCTTSRPCQRTMALPGFPGVSVNDDRFEDFIVPGRENLLTEEMFFGLSSYLREDIPVVTPNSALEEDLYRSGRFMWVPVIAAPAAWTPSDAGWYPVLTFRPIFITQDAPATLTSVDLITDVVDLWVSTLLGIDDTEEDHGLVLDSTGTELRALRFMTIEPGALPSVDPDYTGPLSPYLGTGPKVIRLVR